MTQISAELKQGSNTRIRFKIGSSDRDFPIDVIHETKCVQKYQKSHLYTIAFSDRWLNILVR